MTHLEITAHANGVLLRVQAVPGARRNAILGVRNGALRVAVAQAPEKGKANDALVDLLAKTLRLRRSQILIVEGESSRRKKLFIDNIVADELRERIARSIDPSNSR
jgi:uncharacterized protein (TIGR00251 family)